MGWISAQKLLLSWGNELVSRTWYILSLVLIRYLSITQALTVFVLRGLFEDIDFQYRCFSRSVRLSVESSSDDRNHLNTNDFQSLTEQLLPYFFLRNTIRSEVGDWASNADILFSLSVLYGLHECTEEQLLNTLRAVRCSDFAQCTSNRILSSSQRSTNPLFWISSSRNDNLIPWWRRRESNPRPKAL